MARRTHRGGIFWFALMVIGASICAGGVAAWVTRFNIRDRQVVRAQTPVSSEINANASGMTQNQRALSKLTRDQLEDEVVRLNGAVAERERQIDDLKIQLKLATEGSRSAQ